MHISTRPIILLLLVPISGHQPQYVRNQSRRAKTNTPLFISYPCFSNTEGQASKLGGGVEGEVFAQGIAEPHEGARCGAPTLGAFTGGHERQKKSGGSQREPVLRSALNPALKDIFKFRVVFSFPEGSHSRGGTKMTFRLHAWVKPIPPGLRGCREPLTMISFMRI